MRRLMPIVLRPWTLPLIVVALVVPVVAGFYFGGPPLGLAIGAITAATVILIAARARYDEEIEVATQPDGRYRLLLVAPEAIQEPHAVERIADVVDQARRHSSGEPELRVLAPVRMSTLDRWASDVREGRTEAQRALALSLASLAAAGLDATGKVGDADPVQAIEDELRTYPAREVVLASPGSLEAGRVDELRRRLDRPVRQLGG
jgi:hypothetical protein